MINYLQDIAPFPKLTRGLIVQFQVPKGESWYIVWARATYVSSAAREYVIKVNEFEVRRWRTPYEYTVQPIFLSVPGGSYFTLYDEAYASGGTSQKMLLLINRTVGS